MKRLINIIASALIGINSLTAICSAKDIQPLNPKTRLMQVIEDTENESLKRKIQATDNYLQKFAEYYIIEMQNVSSDYKDNIKTKGKAQVAKDFKAVHDIAFLYAIEHPEKTKILEEDSKKIIDSYYKILIQEAVNSKSHIDYKNEKLTKNVKKEWANWLQYRVDFFRNLLSIDSSTEDSFEEIVRKAYPTKKDYEKYLTPFLKSSDRVYDSLKEGLYSHAVLLGGKGKINKIKKEIKRIYIKDIEAIYPEKK